MIRPTNIIARLGNGSVNQVCQWQVIEHILIRSSLKDCTDCANEGTNTDSLPSAEPVHNDSSKQCSEYSPSAECRVDSTYDGRSRCSIEIVLEVLRGDDISHDTRVITEEKGPKSKQ